MTKKTLNYYCISTVNFQCFSTCFSEPVLTCDSFEKQSSTKPANGYAFISFSVIPGSKLDRHINTLKKSAKKLTDSILSGGCGN